jgi:hypothetical protein
LREDDRLVVFEVIEEMNQIAVLQLGGDEDIELLQVGNSVIFLVDFHPDGVVQ